MSRIVVGWKHVWLLALLFVAIGILWYASHKKEQDAQTLLREKETSSQSFKIIDSTIQVVPAEQSIQIKGR